MPRIKLEEVKRAVKENGHLKTTAEIREEAEAVKVEERIVYSENAKDVFSDTHELAEKFFGDIDYDRDYDRLIFEISRWKEELNEVIDAINAGDAEGVVDGAIDLVTFVLGTLENFGVDGRKAWEVVHEANMRKKRGTKSTRKDSKGIDLVKPRGWKAPDHSDNVGLIAKALDI